MTPALSETRNARGSGLLTSMVAVLGALLAAGVGAWMWSTPFALTVALTSNPAIAGGIGLGAALVTALAFVLGRRAKTWHRDAFRRRATRALVSAVITSMVFTALLITLLVAGTAPDDKFARLLYGTDPLPSWLAHLAATPGSMLHKVPNALLFGVDVLLALDIAARVAVLASGIALWFSVPIKTRLRVWNVIDLLLVAACVWATLVFPFTPQGDSDEAVRKAVARLALTVLVCVRGGVRSLPPLFGLIERAGFRSLVAARHLRSRGSRFVTVIGTLSVLAVSFSSCSLTTTLSVMGGFRNDLKHKILGNTAHVSVRAPEDETLEAWQPLLGVLRQEPGVEGASPYVSGEVMVSSATNLAGAVLRGIDPASVSTVSKLEANMKRGKLEYLSTPEKLLDLPSDDLIDPLPLKRGGKDGGDKNGTRNALEQAMEEASKHEAGDVLPGIIVGQELARSLRLYVGDEVNVVSPLGDLGPTGPIPKSRPFRVAGIFYSGMYEYDLKNVYVALDVGQRFLGTGTDVDGIDLKVDNVDHAPLIRASLQRKLGNGVRVQDWQELNKNLFGALALEKLAMFVALGLAILVAGFCVFGTLTLMVQEKGREVGVLQAMGAGRTDILRIFMTEGLLIGIFGATLGLSMGFVVCYAAKHIGIGMNPEVYYIDRLPVHLDPIEFLLVGVAAAAICLVSTSVPAWLASKTRPVDALRF